jgi:hypothetical protein
MLRLTRSGAPEARRRRGTALCVKRRILRRFGGAGRIDRALLERLLIRLGMLGTFSFLLVGSLSHHWLYLSKYGTISPVAPRCTRTLRHPRGVSLKRISNEQPFSGQCGQTTAGRQGAALGSTSEPAWPAPRMRCAIGMGAPYFPRERGTRMRRSYADMGGAAKFSRHLCSSRRLGVLPKDPDSARCRGCPRQPCRADIAAMSNRCVTRHRSWL